MVSAHPRGGWNQTVRSGTPSIIGAPNGGRYPRRDGPLCCVFTQTSTSASSSSWPAGRAQCRCSVAGRQGAGTLPGAQLAIGIVGGVRVAGGVERGSLG